MASVLEEKDAIREVLGRYCFALDGMLKRLGIKSEFAAGLRANRPGQSSGQGAPRAIHHVTNIVITLNGDTAKVRSNWTTVQNSPEGPKIGSGGAYDDDMVKIGGEWFFKYRTIDRYIRPENE